MPFYNYRCNDKQCGHEMPNQLKKFSDKTITCEKCKKETSEQQFSGLFAAHGLPNGHNAVRVRRG